MPKKTLKKPKTKIRTKPVRKPVESKKIETCATQTIDATDQILGRLATRVANLLRGKHKPTFLPYLSMGDKVVIINASKIKVTGSKMISKVYYRHSGYPGHLKSRTMQEIFQKNPSEIVKRAVWGMLPKNRLRKKWMKNLTIFNGAKNAQN